MQEVYTSSQSVRSESSIKVLRNTYALLSMTLLFSAACAGISMAMGIGQGLGLIMSLAALALVWFVLPKTANSINGIYVVFAFTGLLGAALGPMLNHYLAMENGGSLVMQALGSTAVIFIALSAYVLSTGKDFSFMGGFLAAGVMVMLLAMVALMVAGFMGVDISMMSLALSAGVALLMCGMILYQTSAIINGGETNYIMATASLYISIYNLFTSLLHLLGASND